MNILLINHYAGSPKLGMEYRPYYLAKYWHKSGHNVTIIAASHSHVRSIQPNSAKRYQEESVDGIKYIWLRTPSYNGNGFRRTINMTVFILNLFLFSKRIIRQIDPDTVIASSTYPLDIFPAYLISVRSKAKLVYEVHDLWPLSPIELGGYSKWNPYVLIMQFAENFAYSKAFQVASILPLTLDHMTAHGLSPGKFNYIPNGIEVEEWKDTIQLPQDYMKLVEFLKSKNKKLIGYAGSLGLANALDYLIDAAKILESENIAFLIVGKGPEKQKLINKIDILNLRNVYILDPIKKDMIPFLLSQMDTLYIGLQKQSLFRFGISPNKLIDYMMAAKPVVQAIEAGNDIVSDAKCGITVEPENPKQIADAIRNILNMPESERNILGENGRKYVLENHNYGVLAKKFIEILSKNP